MTPSLRRYILARDKFTCHYCGETKVVRLTVDHIRPRALGGTDETDNLITACRKCNSTKNDKWPENRQFLSALARRRDNVVRG